MPIIINHNLCDEAPECGGIEVCKTKAFQYDYKKGVVCIDQSKCSECLNCTLPDVCPVGCILYARNEKESQKINKMIRSDKRTKAWLWKERYGCQPGKTPPKAIIMNESNFKRILNKKGWKLFDVWHYDYLDCRVSSVLIEDLLGSKQKKVEIYKLDAKSFPELKRKLKVKKLPTLILYKDNTEKWRYRGLIDGKRLEKTYKTITDLIE